MDAILGKIAAVIERYWHRPSTAVIATVLVSLVLYLLVSDNTINTPTIAGWVTVGLGSALFLVTWAFTNRVPRVPKGKTGIVIAIDCDDDKHARHVQADFVETLRGLIERSAPVSNFHMISLPKHVTARLVDQVSVEKYLRRVRGHFILFGRVRRRKVRGRDTHILNCEGMVVHSPIPRSVQQELATDFTLAVPRRLLIDIDNDALEFEATSEWVQASAKYVVGIAAYVSGDVAYAERLFIDVETTLKSSLAGIAPLREVARKLPKRFEQLYETWLRHLVGRYIQTRDRVYIERTDEVASKLLGRNPNHIGALISKSMSEFVLRRDVAAARKLAYQCRRIRDAIWLYNLAFLDAYEGNLSSARTEYDRAFKRPVQDVTVPIQCEEFIHMILEEEPDKFPLLFGAGLINYFAKNDYLSASRDFRAFLEQVPDASYPNQVKEARDLLEDCEDRLAEPAA